MKTYQTISKKLQMLDKLPESVDEFSRRSMIIFPFAIIDTILNSGKEIFIIQRSALKAYFVENYDVISYYLLFVNNHIKM